MPTPRRNLELLQTAYHEAGHAVLALALGQRFRKLTVIPEGSAVGQLKSPINPRHRRLGPRYWTWILARLIVLHGGLVGELQFNRRFRQSKREILVGDDLDRAWQICLGIAGNHEELAGEVAAACTIWVGRLMWVPWWQQAIDEIAQALAARKELEFSACYEIASRVLERLYPALPTCHSKIPRPLIGEAGSLSPDYSPFSSDRLFRSIVKQNSNAGSKKNGRKTLGQTGLNPFVAEKVGRAWWLFARPAVFPFPVPLFYFTKKKECEFFQRLFNAAVADFSASSTATIERYLRSPRRRGSR